MLENPIPRPATRVLLLDSTNRSLLFCSLDDVDERFWYPPGGAIEPGENTFDAAYRELAEETGRHDIDLGAEIGFRRHRTVWKSKVFEFQEFWYLAQTSHFEVDTSGFTEDEREDVTFYRWWPLEELRTTTDRLVPRDLASLVEEIVRNGPPSSPIELGV